MRVDFYDMSEPYREQDDIRHEHATTELTDDTISLASLLLVAAGVVAIWLLLGWAK